MNLFRSPGLLPDPEHAVDPSAVASFAPRYGSREASRRWLGPSNPGSSAGAASCCKEGRASASCCSA